MSMAPEMVTIKPGTFVMGAGDDDKFATDTERPAHAVSIEHSFALGRSPVTVAEYRYFAPHHEADGLPEWPVVNVSWYDALRYCVWLSEVCDRTYRLPTEAEWEFACRAGTTEPFNTGESLMPGHANYLYSEDGMRIGRGSRTAVGSFPENRFGVRDMHGNVCEWVADVWRPNYADTQRDADRLDRRVIRGGAWDHLPRMLRSAWRDGLPAGTRRDNVGFRIAATLEN